MTYSSAGVDRQGADAFVDQIQALMKKMKSSSPHRARLHTGIGGYASVFKWDKSKWLAASTDGVGTKLKLAFLTKKHSTIGIDLVAMSVNDLLCVGAEPLLFLDYFATGKLEPAVGLEVLRGILEGCRQAGCLLVGGETAEMPSFYAEGEYDLGGFAVGWLKPQELLPTKKITPGNVLVGLRSSGVHSNGFSLIRKWMDENPGEGPALEEWLTPTRIYSRALLPLIRQRKILGLAHITGSGFLNLPRISEKVSYQVELPGDWDSTPVYRWIRQVGKLDLAEMVTTFNCGVGMVMVVDKKNLLQILKALKKAGENPTLLGKVVKRKKGKPSQVMITDLKLGCAELDY